MPAFAALADPTRRRILELLRGGERSAGDIVAAFDVSAPAISQHLKVLREARLVAVRPHAQRRLYRLDPDGLREIDAWLARMGRFWSDRLDALERELRAPAPPRKKKTSRRRTPR